MFWMFCWHSQTRRARAVVLIWCVSAGRSEVGRAGALHAVTTAVVIFGLGPGARRRRGPGAGSPGSDRLRAIRAGQRHARRPESEDQARSATGGPDGVGQASWL